MAQGLKEASKAAEHGQHIFIYGHARTNQIIYSLRRTMNVPSPSCLVTQNSKTI